MSSVNLQRLHEGCLRPDPSREKNKANRIRFVSSNQPTTASSQYGFPCDEQEPDKDLQIKLLPCTPPHLLHVSPPFPNPLPSSGSPPPNADHLGFLAVS